MNEQIAKDFWENSTLSVKKIARELKKSISTVRDFFKNEYGEEIYNKRAADLKIKNQTKRGKTKNSKIESRICFKCSNQVELTKIQIAKLNPKKILCEDCQFEGHEIKVCPVCQNKYKDNKGLAAHFRHQKEAGCVEHISYYETEQLRLKSQKRIEKKKNRSESAKRGHIGRNYSETKIILCPECAVKDIEVNKYVSPDYLKRIKCNECLEKEAQILLDIYNKKLIDGIDYIKCKICEKDPNSDDYHTEKSLISHINTCHTDILISEYKKQYNCEVITQKYSEKISESQTGKKHSTETRLKIQKKAGWSKDLTKEVDSRIKNISEGVLASFEFGNRKDPIQGYNFTKEEILKYQTIDGKILIREAAQGLYCTPSTIKKYCSSYNLEIESTTLGLQKTVLSVISDIFKQYPYILNATFDCLRYCETGFPFIYDGYFGGPLHLVVEIQGYQHFIKDNIFHKTEKEFLEAQKRDKYKKKTALNYGFNYLAVNYDEDISEESIRRKLRKIYKLNLNELISPKTYNINLPDPAKSEKQKEKQKRYKIELLKWFWMKNGFPYEENTISNENLDNEFNKTYLEIPRTTSLIQFTNSYMPHMWDISVDQKAPPKEIYASDIEKIIENRLEYSIKDAREITPGYIRTGIKLSTAVAKNFSPAIAKYLIEKYGKDETHLWDPCCGFGGRLLGAYLSKNCFSYQGCEPSTKTYAGLIQLSDDLKQQLIRENFNISIFGQPLEDFNIKKKFNLILTSPPYFNKELYAEESTQSHIKFPTYKQWKDGFLKALVEQSWNILKKDSYAIYMINNYQDFSIKEDFMQLMLQKGFKLENIEQYTTNHVYKGKHSEPLLIFKK